MINKENVSILDIDTVALDDENSSLVIIDQTKLPNTIEIEHLTTLEEAFRAIKRLEVRGAPAIGVSAAIAAYLDAKAIYKENNEIAWEEFIAKFEKDCDYLNSSRPTAVNLSWALKRMLKCAFNAHEDGANTEQVVAALHTEAVMIRDEDIEVCRAIGENGLTLIKDGDGLITHCNAGKLCAVRYGTATAPMYVGQERGYTFHVTCDETRPLLQGSRLTAFELMASGIDTTVECDGMSASRIREGYVQAAFVGCDRVAANGDVANKIGTSMLALACKRYNVPFYVCAPTSTIDMSCETGQDIVIEQRDSSEVTDMWYKEPMAPRGVNVYNPAFDVTDNDLVDALVTEYGVIRPPFKPALEKLFEEINNQ